jgi:NAD(P)-dependent dehydrogenase (short-subunit alcohol dehydrogenase family)
MTTTRSSTPRALDSAALVTGATSGIGRTTAVRLAARGQAPTGRVTALEEIAAAHLAV